MQLVELQKRLPELERGGFAVFAVSYDPVAVLAGFGERWGITYRLLSDEGSRVIRELGLYNERLAEQAAYYGVVVREHHHGVPYPGTFVLDDRGVVVEKRFEQSYRIRPSGAALVEQLLGADEAAAALSARAEAAGVGVRAWLADQAYRPYQQLRLHVVLELGPDTHVYGDPVPDGYQPLRVELEPIQGLAAGPVELPPARPLRVAGLDEEFVGYEGRVDAALPFSINARSGPVVLAVRVAFQACDEAVCHPPSAVRLELPLAAEDVIRD